MIFPYDLFCLGKIASLVLLLLLIFAWYYSLFQSLHIPSFFFGQEHLVDNILLDFNILKFNGKVLCLLEFILQVQKIILIFFLQQFSFGNNFKFIEDCTDTPHPTSSDINILLWWYILELISISMCFMSSYQQNKSTFTFLPPFWPISFTPTIMLKSFR